MSLREQWEAEAEEWVSWAREPGHDSYWRFHRDAFFALVPSPGRLTVEIGCGEGRVARDLKERGHRVVAIDASPTMVRHAREADPALDVRLADGVALPLEDESADLVVAFMSLMNVDDLEGVLRETHRVLAPGGRLCAATTHPLNTAGEFDSRARDAPFTLERSYFEEWTKSQRVERDGLAFTFHDRHRPLQSYTDALEQAGLLIESLREIPNLETAPEPAAARWQRIPLFLHLRALRPEQADRA